MKITKECLNLMSFFLKNNCLSPLKQTKITDTILTKLYNELTNHYVIKRQFKPNWCKNPKTNKYLPFDFILEDLNIIVEQDGPQHFKQIGDWLSPELTRINDIYKMKCANENGYSMIRLLQKDIWNDRYDWLQELLVNINKIILDKRVQNIYMCKKDEYKYFEISI